MCFGLGIIILIIVCVIKNGCEDHSESNHMRNMTNEERSEYIYKKSKDELNKKLR